MDEILKCLQAIQAQLTQQSLLLLQLLEALEDDDDESIGDLDGHQVFTNRNDDLPL